MDSLFRLFCGCCGMQPGGDGDAPYAQLREDNVTPVRDPPIQATNRSSHYQQAYRPPHDDDDGPFGFNNGEFVFEAPDGHPYRDAVQEYVNNGRNMETHSPPPCEPKKERTKEEIEEKAAYDNIIETTQHSIIAIGQTETVDSNVGMEIHYREKAYKEKAKKMNSFQAKKEKPAESLIDHDFDLLPTHNGLEVPLEYDSVSATIDPSPIERMPFSCPDFNQIVYARPMGIQNPSFLVEHPDVKNAGNINGGITKSKINEFLDEVHQAVTGIEVEPKQDLIVSMDF